MTDVENQEWDFIVKETHESDTENRIKRELLFIMQGELSKQKPNMGFYLGRVHTRKKRKNKR